MDGKLKRISGLFAQMSGRGTILGTKLSFTDNLNYFNLTF